MVLHDQRPEYLLGVWGVGAQVLVRDALEPPLAVAAHQPGDQVSKRAVVADQVCIRGQTRERPLDPERHVGVEQQQVLGGAAGERHQLAPVAPEVSPLRTMELAGHPGQRRLDPRRRVVDRARVADHPPVDEAADAVQAALDHPGLVLDDHAQGDRGPAVDQ